MRRIELTQGRIALIDDEDFDWLSKWKWYYARKNVRKLVTLVETVVDYHNKQSTCTPLLWNGIGIKSTGAKSITSMPVVVIIEKKIFDLQLET